MKIATYNVNGVNGHLPVLLRWLKEAAPDIACLQELKAPQEKFPESARRDAGAKAPAILLALSARLERRSDPITPRTAHGAKKGAAGRPRRHT